ncbi:MAG TPA: Type 1 glutamine amidotransferase-like domain-containing protein [Acidimicrobiia bacterium]|jgi:cyanophycinase|nr:Type 1 glutamine amidotransferase-like domain-containing protein [Acidimicrobiia bacterium]
MKRPAGSIALVGGGEWTEPCRALDSRLLHLADTDEVLIVPTAAAFEHPERAVEHAIEWFRGLGANAVGLAVLNRRDAETDEYVAAMRVARFVYLADGSPLHLRSVLKGSALFDALCYAHGRGAVIAASGAGATVVCDPMVDPRGGAYTVGLGIVKGVAVFPDHAGAADHRRERSLELQPDDAVLVGLDEHTAIVRQPSGRWNVIGPGHATVYRAGLAAAELSDGDETDLDEVVTSR